MTNTHFVRDVLQYNTRDLYIYLHKRVKTATTRADLHVGNRWRGVQGVTYFVPYIILGPTVLAKLWAPKNCFAYLHRLAKDTVDL